MRVALRFYPPLPPIKRIGLGVQLGFFSAHLVLNLITIPIEPGIELTRVDGNAEHDGN
jgi:hypothetical protein